MPKLDERTLCARFKSWIDAELQQSTYGGLTRAENEVHAAGSKKRHDLLIYAGNQPVFSLEVKLPQSAEGSSPFQPSVVEDARRKAEREGLRHFGTTNCASFVLWKVDMPGVPVLSRHIDKWTVVEPQHLTQLDSLEAEASMRDWVKRLLETLTAIEAGASLTPSESQPGDELIDRIEGSLDTIVGLTLPDVMERFSTDKEFRRDVKRWMITDRGWQWDDKLRDELLLRTVKVACYLQMNRLLFYSTIQGRFPELPELDLSQAKSGRGMKRRLEPRFKQAMEASRDYETVFDVGYISEVAYAGDASTTAWSGLLPGIDGVDLASVRLDILGGIFERLLSPEERHRFGQHYTNPELVDLLVASSVRSREDVVFDPASGGGTFLVRAYERIRHLGESDHLVLLSQLYGNDLSRFAGHLTTVNLAVRQIAREENYPRIGTHDFFDLEPGGTLTKLPLGAGTPSQQKVAVPEELNAVIGNPPYVRRQAIDGKTLKRAKASTTRYAAEASRKSFTLDGLSDLHVYFWPHATRFIKPGGYIAFLTSNGWLQARYGNQLKQLLLNEFDILFMAETNAEPWFSDARVKTVATVARRRVPGTDASPDHLVHFCQLRAPLLELLGLPEAPDRWDKVESLLERIQTEQRSSDLRVRAIPQTDLAAEDDWSPPLRAPDLYDRFVSLPSVTNVCSKQGDPDDPFVLTVGPKLGSSWFVVQDITDQASDDDLATWGVKRAEVVGASPLFRIVQGGDWRGPVESRYLSRWVRGPGDEPTRVTGPSAGDLVITISRNKRPRKTARVNEYIKFGESQNEHTRVYTGQRGANWFCVEEMERGPIIAPAASQYGHKIWANPNSKKFTTSPNAYLTPRDADVEVAAALLNSTWTYLAALFDAGSVGTEGLVRFGGRGSWRRLHVIDPRSATEDQAERLRDCWQALSREAVDLFPPEGSEELGGLRRELDEVALMVAGVSDPVDASELVDELYEWLPRYTESRAEVEDMAVAGRSSSGGTARIQGIVDQTVGAVAIDPPWLKSVDDLWSKVELPDETPDLSPQVQLFGYDGHVEEPTDVRFGDTWIRFDTEEQADFVRELSAARMAPRSIAVPPPALAAGVHQLARDFVADVQGQLREALTERISKADPAYARIFVLSLGQLAATVRTALHAAPE